MWLTNLELKKEKWIYWRIIIHVFHLGAAIFKGSTLKKKALIQILMINDVKAIFHLKANLIKVTTEYNVVYNLSLMCWDFH